MLNISYADVKDFCKLKMVTALLEYIDFSIEYMAVMMHCRVSFHMLCMRSH